MKSKHNSKFKSVLSAVLASVMLLGTIPQMTVFAAQSNEYVDPEDSWIVANGRTNELDMNATTTYETQYCFSCGKHTTVLAYRVPEYTRSGETAANRGVNFSDGYDVDGKNKYNLDDGTPGVDAKYTGYHWTKTVCNACGTLNPADGTEAYNYNRNIYGLNPCDHNFFVDFDNTEYTPYNSTQHYVYLKEGEYCAYCKGTYAQAVLGRTNHDFSEKVDAQLSNNRFYVAETCSDCGYETSEYVIAKSVVTSYYGEVDGEAHTVEVSDLSESDVTTRIRYGTEAGKCNRTSAPNFTNAGYHTVYYEIDYIYGGETMTENGVGYVWLLENNKNDSSNGIIIVVPPAHEHDYHYLETVKPSCDSLGYDRFQCNGCGDLIKTNYVQALGHNYGEVLIREATCKQNGVKLHMCKSCGDFYEESTPLADHDYEKHTHNSTCKSVGYDEYTCKVCGDNYINNMKPMIDHKYRTLVRKPTCEEKGYTSYICEMCNGSYVSDYTKALGHKWDDGRTVTSSGCVSEGVVEYLCTNDGCKEKLILATDASGHTPGKEATCTEPQICEVCETVLELPKGHTYTDEVTEATCESSGYTTHTCSDCGHSYKDEYTDLLPHDYDVKVTEPTCTTMGYSTYTCKNCGDEYVSDYTDKKAHDYAEVKTPATCTEFGYSTFTCKNCDESYVSNYVDKLPHRYSESVTPPSCTEDGFTVFTCEDCGKEYIGNYTDEVEHDYDVTVVEPTCTAMGYSVYKCKACGHEYKGDYKDKKAHNYTKTTTEATCKLMGYDTFTCEDCDDTYKANYTEPKGHLPSEWIIDVPATIEQAGERHIECLTCKEVLSRGAISQLVDKDRTDEDGQSKVGDYSILLTDSKGKPIFDSEIVIDVNDNVTIKLPNGRLLDFADQTIITAIYTDTQKAKSDLQIFIYDENNNAATGKTDASGQLKVPNDKSSTGDDNGTIGNGDKDKETYVVTVTDKYNVVIPYCEVYIGESNNIVVDLPTGTKPTRENPVIVTVTDQNGNAQVGVTIIALGDSDFIEKGKTDVYGKITLPTSNDGFTNAEGRVNVNERNVVVSNEDGVIKDAYVVYNEDGTISVELPEGKLISHHNRVTVKVLDSVAKPISDVTVSVNDKAEVSYTAKTDENGQIVVPPLSEDMTDSEGKAKVNGYNVLITDETKPIENAFVTIGEGQINVVLPEGVLIDINNRITATITDSEDKPVKDMTVIFTDTLDVTESNVTDENGKATVPPTNIDVTDFNGYSEVDGYIVTVKSETAPIEKADVKHTPEVLNDDGTVKEAENISVELPENIKFDYADRITVTVAKKADNSAVKDMVINISEFAVENVETKSLTAKTDKNGVAVFPPLNEGETDTDGKTDVTDKTPETDDKEEIKTIYNILVEDTKGKIENAFIEVKDGKISVKLPDTHTLTTSNQTTVTVTDKDNKPMANVSVTISDATTSKTGTTNSNGKVTLPVKSTGGGGGSSSGGSSGGGGSYIGNTVNVKVVDKDNKTVSVSKSTGTEKVTLTLPNGKNLLKDDNYYTITVTDRSNKAKADYTVVLKDKNGNEVKGTTDKNGVVTLPAAEHKAYIKGYTDGTFRPEGDMTRSEAAAIFARLIAEKNGEKITGKSTFADIKADAWYADSIAYLEKYNVINGYNDGTFKPEMPVTRAEFVAMTVRFNALFNEVDKKNYTVNYTDVTKSYWAYNDIAFAKNIGWLNGYADGTFKGDNAITRAEVVTVVNRATERNADSDYITKNYTKLNRFTDVTDSSMWYFFDVLSAANTIQCADCPHLD